VTYNMTRLDDVISMGRGHYWQALETPSCVERKQAELLLWVMNRPSHPLCAMFGMCAKPDIQARSVGNAAVSVPSNGPS
jgi:hypothetical protein